MAVNHIGRTFKGSKFLLLCSSLCVLFSANYASAQDSAPPPSVGDFQSLLNSIPAPDQQANESSAQQQQTQQTGGFGFPSMRMPDRMAPPQYAAQPQQPNQQNAPVQQAPNSPPPIPGIAEEELNGLTREEQLKLRQEKEKKEFYDLAFQTAIDSMFVLKPEEIRRFMEIYDENRQAVDTIMYNHPTPEIAVKTLSLDPGHVPTVIDTAMGHVTTVTIVDASGQPWPIADITYAGEFEISNPTQDENILRIMPMTHFAKGNMSMRLLGLKVPLVISLNTRRDKVYYRLDLRVPEYGPKAVTPLIDVGPVSITAGNSTIASVLDGLPPQGALALDVNGADSRTKAYRYNGKLYLRTPLTLLSPGWQGSASSGDGMNVYELADAPVLLLSDGGKMVRASLTDREIK